jgi:RimJ/RimL family protein N-acetyltransferase
VARDAGRAAETVAPAPPSQLIDPGARSRSGTGRTRAPGHRRAPESTSGHPAVTAIGMRPHGRRVDVDVRPLLALRLRTPRLELRLAAHGHIAELYRVAAAGIHPPDEMPFGVAWTDTLNERDFVAYHEGLLEAWAPGCWNAAFVSLLDGRVVGTQSLHGRDFAECREVGSGSWLGRAWQRRGLGTEQRAAVLELAFRGLGARAATSGAIWDNLASQRVSRKLGYRLVGESTVSPRGAPVRRLDYRLDAAEWRAPIVVELEGLEDALALFGAR